MLGARLTDRSRFSPSRSHWLAWRSECCSTRCVIAGIRPIAPGFRVGWMVAPAALIERFDTAKQSVDLMSGSFDQRMIHAAVTRGVLQKLAPTLPKDNLLVMNLCGRGDKDVFAIAERLGVKL